MRILNDQWLRCRGSEVTSFRDTNPRARAQIQDSVGASAPRDPTCFVRSRGDRMLATSLHSSISQSSCCTCSVCLREETRLQENGEDECWLRQQALERRSRD